MPSSQEHRHQLQHCGLRSRFASCEASSWADSAAGRKDGHLTALMQQTRMEHPILSYVRRFLQPSALVLINKLGGFSVLLKSVIFILPRHTWLSVGFMNALPSTLSCRNPLPSSSCLLTPRSTQMQTVPSEKGTYVYRPKNSVRNTTEGLPNSLYIPPFSYFGTFSIFSQPA